MDPAGLLVLVVATGKPSPMADSVERALHQALGPEAVVVVEPVPELPGDEGAVAEARRRGLRAVGEIAFVPSDHGRARLRVRADPAGPWLDREIGFAAADAPSEEGRTLGYVLASMLPETSWRVPPVPAIASALPPAALEGSPSPTPPRHRRGTLEAAAVGGAAFGGYGGGLGGALAFEWLLSDTLALRGEGQLRTLVIGPASGTLTTLTFGGGLSWRHSVSSRVDLGLRLDLLALREAVTHFDYDEPTQVGEERWLPAAEAMVDGDWRFTDDGALFLGLGAEVAMGQTVIFSHDRDVATLVPARGLLETGIRLRF